MKGIVIFVDWWVWSLENRYVAREEIKKKKEKKNIMKIIFKRERERKGIEMKGGFE